MISLQQLNQMDPDAAQQWFAQTCAATNWVQLMEAGRPYTSLAALENTAATQWATLEEPDYLQAFEAHPMIGDVNSLRAKYASTKDMASREQSGATGAPEQVIQALSQLNHEYLNKFGFIFIICASGLSAQSMLSELQRRIHNDRSTEIKLASTEQINITLLRINKGLQKDTVHE